MDDVPGGIERLGSIEKAQPGRHDPDLRVIEGAHEPLDAAGRHDRVRVEEDEDVAGRLLHAPVVSTGKAEVLPRGEDGDEIARPGGRDLRAGIGAVVDDDHLADVVLGRLEGVEETPERLARLERNDDDAGRRR